MQVIVLSLYMVTNEGPLGILQVSLSSHANLGMSTCGKTVRPPNQSSMNLDVYLFSSLLDQIAGQWGLSGTFFRCAEWLVSIV